jgi:hypothetical protein
LPATCWPSYSAAWLLLLAAWAKPLHRQKPPNPTPPKFNTCKADSLKCGLTLRTRSLIVSYFTPDEKLRLSFEPFNPGDPPIGYMAAERSSGSCPRTFQANSGRTYTSPIGL